MVPAAYGAFFAASMGAAAALLGLLFVAVSIAPERTVVRGAPVERQVAADSVFTALINAFFVSMGGALPNINLAVVALPLSIVSLVQTLYAGWKLWPHQGITRSSLRPLSLVVAGLVIYGFQLADSYQLARDSADVGSFVGLIALLFATYALGIVRSWQLLGAERGGFLHVLRELLGGEDAGEPAAAPEGPSPSAESTPAEPAEVKKTSVVESRRPQVARVREPARADEAGTTSSDKGGC